MSEVAQKESVGHSIQRALSLPPGDSVQVPAPPAGSSEMKIPLKLVAAQKVVDGQETSPKYSRPEGLQLSAPGSVEVKTSSSVTTTQSVELGQEIERTSSPTSIAVPSHASAPPAGSSLTKTLPFSSPARQKVEEAQAIAVSGCPLPTAVAVHAPWSGSSETSTYPVASTAAQKSAAGQETAFRSAGAGPPSCDSDQASIPPVGSVE